MTAIGRLLPLTSLKIIPDERPLLDREQSQNLQYFHRPQKLQAASGGLMWFTLFSLIRQESFSFTIIIKAYPCN
jgi:hypothetical protein